jgi:hypothetical protein
VVVASGLMGVALVVLLSNLGTVVIGGRVAERRVVEERLARNQMELLFKAPVTSPCPSPAPQVVDNITYTVTVTCSPQPNYMHYKVKASDGSNSTQLEDDRWKA